MSEHKVTIVGSYISPYVRKVLVCLALKGVAYRIDPIIPYFGNAEFSRLSPLRRIPLLIDGPVILSDSTVICEYLEEQHPGPALFPGEPVARARARWLEEFADTRMGEVFIWRLFNQRVINPYVWGQAADESILQKTVDQDIPGIMDYLENAVPGAAYLDHTIGIADISLASFFRNAAFAGYTMDGERWPLTKAYIDHVLAHPGFLGLRPFEELQVRTPIARQRQALLAAGAPLTEFTLGAETPQRGIFSI